MAKKTAAKAAPKPTKITAAKKPRSKGEIYRLLAEHSGTSRKQVSQMFDALGQLLAADLSKGTDFNLAGFMKVRVISKPATKGGTRPNPFKPGEMMEVKPKPARKIVKVRPMKALKALV
jgi:nucleoid DNA-binding protein